ncbi:MAG: hypothetical protein AABX37_02575 [Nanoarchaeota archaeon]
MNLSPLIRNLSNPHPEVHNAAVDALQEYFWNTDLDLPTRDLRYVY